VLSDQCRKRQAQVRRAANGAPLASDATTAGRFLNYGWDGYSQPLSALADLNAWVSAGCFGLGQGIVAMMIENHRSELIWRLLRECSHVHAGLRRTGFSGGWL